MNNKPAVYALLATLILAPGSNLLAQRRTTTSPPSSPPSGGRATPSSGGRSSGGESSRPSSGEGRRGSGESSSGSSGSGSSTRSRDNGNGNNGNGSAQSGNSGRESSDANSAGRPSSGKIARVKARAEDVRERTRRGGGVIYTGGVYLGGCYNCYYWGAYGGRWGWYDGGWWYPARNPYYGGYHGGGYYNDRRDRDDANYDDEDVESDFGQGYLPYPYAESDGTGETFVRRRTTQRHGFGAVSGYYFSDVGSTTRAGHVMVEGAIRSFRADLEYGSYAEPLAVGTDHFQTLRFAVGVQPALGKQAYLIAGLGARGLFLGDGSNAGGPEGTLGIQAFPFRPIGLNVTGRVAAMTWTGSDRFMMTELNTTGSLFLGRVELQGGWHWMKMEGSPGFGGPVIGTRIWF